MTLASTLPRELSHPRSALPVMQDMPVPAEPRHSALLVPMLMQAAALVPRVLLVRTVR